MKKPLLISACLLGVACRYDGRSKPLDRTLIDKLMARWALVPMCPESYGGLAAPRDPSEISGSGVFSKSGADVTAQYRKGAQQACYLAKLFGCETALLKERSPSCGSGQVYDGSFTGILIPGDGVTAAALKEMGVRVLGESDVSMLV